MRILITGACGWTAEAIIQALYEEEHVIIGFDLACTEPDDSVVKCFTQIHKGDISNYEQVAKAVSGVDTIIHLAVAIGAGDYDSPKIPFDVNVRGTANLFEVARKQNIKHVILMSSAAVHLNSETIIDAVEDCLCSPEGDFLYDMTKCLQENIGRHYAQVFGMTVITLRAGHIVDGRKNITPDGYPLSELNYCRGGWICRYDLTQAVIKALDYEHKGYDAFHIIGAKAAQDYLDTTRSKQILGFVAKIKFEEYL
jgi:nucleoside-diphosphate-sugar epimerase